VHNQIVTVVGLVMIAVAAAVTVAAVVLGRTRRR